MSSLREKAIRAHPDFPWIDADQREAVQNVLRTLGLLEADEALTAMGPAGEGNMNLTLRLHTPRRRFILKQARPWVERYPEIAAPWDRSRVEWRFYEIVGNWPEVADRMPKILGAHEAAHLIVLEDLAEARDMTSLYGDDAPSSTELLSLADYLAALHERSRNQELVLKNREMRALNHEHVFSIPFANALDLDAFEPGLREAANRIAERTVFRQRVTETAERYLADGPTLVHGDFFPGSWLRTRDGIKVIDPEFGHMGAPELDLGVAVAHLALTARPSDEGLRFLERYHARARRLDPTLIASFASIEVVRRLIGVAQLPIPATNGWRTALLERACAAMEQGRTQELFDA